MDGTSVVSDLPSRGGPTTSSHAGRCTPPTVTTGPPTTNGHFGIPRDPLCGSTLPGPVPDGPLFTSLRVPVRSVIKTVEVVGTLGTRLGPESSRPSSVRRSPLSQGHNRVVLRHLTYTIRDFRNDTGPRRG